MSANITVTNSSREGARYLATQASTLASPYGTTCPTGTTAPSSPSAQSKAWNQMLGANLDLSKVTVLTVYFYKSSNDPSNDSNHTAYDKMVSCNVSGGAFSGGYTLTNGSNTGDSTYVPQTGDWGQFRVQYQYTTATPIIHTLVPTITVDQTTTMVLE